MKAPVDPDVMRIKQNRNKYAIQAAFALLGMILIIAVFCIALWLSWGTPGAVPMTVIFIGGLSLVGCVVCIIGISISGGEAIDYHNDYRWKLNAYAWNAQQEELQRIRKIMKEEGL